MKKFIIVLVLILSAIAFWIVNLQYARSELSSFEQEELKNMLNVRFGMDPGEYDLYYALCSDPVSYGDQVMEAAGIYKDGKEFKILFQKKGCGSSGCGCGEDICFFVANGGETHYEEIKERLCNKLEYLILDEGTANYTENKTDEIRKSCLEGGYEQVIGKQRTLFISRSSCRGSVTDSSLESCNGENSTDLFAYSKTPEGGASKQRCLAASLSARVNGYKDLAVSSGDTAYCRKIGDIGNAYRGSHLFPEKMLATEIAGNDISMDSCFTDVARKKVDRSACEEIIDQEKREYCHMIYQSALAEQTGNKSLCNQIRIANLRSSCMESVPNY